MPLPRPSTSGMCRVICGFVLLGFAPAFAGEIVVGSFTKNTSTGSQVISHSLGVTPKAIITWTAHTTSESSTGTARFGLGMSDGIREAAISLFSDDAVGVSNAECRHVDKVIGIHGNAEADLSSWNSSTFTINWTTNFGTASTIHYMLIGGSDISAKVQTWSTAGSGAGTQAVTGVGFQPDVAIHFYSGSITSIPGSTSNADVTLGVMDANGRQWTTTNYIIDNQGTTNVQRGQRTDRCSFDLNSNLTTWRDGAFASMDSDGFSIAWTRDPDSVPVATLCLSGVNAHAGTFTKVTGAGPISQSVTGVNFQPEGLFLNSWQQIAISSGQTHGSWGFGGTDGASEGCIAFQDTDAVGTSATDRIGKTSKVFVSIDNAAGTVETEGDLTSFDSDGFTVNWTTNHTNADQICYLAMIPFDSMAVTFGGGTAQITPTGTSIEWTTTSQEHSLGFRVYRGPSRESLLGFVPVVSTPELSPFLAASTYDFEDPAGDAQSVYWIEEVDQGGNSSWCGPIPVGSPVPSGPSPLNWLPPASTASEPWHDAWVNYPALAPASRTRLETQWSLTRRQGLKKSLIEIGVDQTGWIQVSPAELFAAGLDRAIDPRTLSLYADGVPIAMRVEGEDDGRLDPTDRIGFYGVESSSAESPLRVYWLTDGANNPLRIPCVRGGFGGVPAGRFEAVRSYQPRENYFASLRNGNDENFFGPLVSTTPIEVVAPLSTWRDAALSPIRLEWTFQGVSDSDHELTWTLEGVDRGTFRFDGRERATFSVDIPPSWFSSTDLHLAVRSANPEDLSMLATIVARTDEELVLTGEPIHFELSGGRDAQIEGLDVSSALILDLTDPRAPRELIPLPGSSSSSTWVRPPHSATTPVIALAHHHATAPRFVRTGAPSRWSAPENDGDFVIIADAIFHRELQPLVAARRQAGWQVALIDLQDLYDEFSFGTPNASAIPRFLERALAAWTTPPRALLLVGDATYDPRGHLGPAPTMNLPSAFFDSDQFESVSDELLVDLDGDGLGEVTVGRFPVSTVADCKAWVTRTVNYLPRGSDGLAKALLITDTSSAFDYRAVVDDQWTLPSSSVVTCSIDLDTSSLAAARAALGAELSSGVDLVYYFGHGGRSVWSAQGLLTLNDMPSLNNSPDHPVVISMSCLNGFFQHPSSESLSEALGKAPTGGAVAVWAPSILAGPAVERELSRGLIEQLFSVRPATLGEAVRGAKSVVQDPAVRAGWILFGDPTLPLVFGP